MKHGADLSLRLNLTGTTADGAVTFSVEESTIEIVNGEDDVTGSEGATVGGLSVIKRLQTFQDWTVSLTAVWDNSEGAGDPIDVTGTRLIGNKYVDFRDGVTKLHGVCVIKSFRLTGKIKQSFIYSLVISGNGALAVEEIA